MSILETHKLSFAYPGQSPLLSDFDFRTESSERTELRAPSGRGKTTFCRLLAGYLKATSGAIILDGKPLPKKGRCPIQLIGQHPETAVDPRLRLRLTLEEAAPLTPDNGNQELLERLGIRNEWLQRYPHELSGGELQRFCVARALMANPQFLIADEITTMLDAVTQVQIWKALLEEATKRGFGMILVTHSPALSKRIATRVVEL
ncbi:MAG: ATP-binding cassette domain-containing protein [Coriobacteriales bacterium]|nr:ATP-binding cassette domain-containing protein [Coriobacteriales bacterium]